MAVEWDAVSMSTGIEQVDEQHRTLIARLNALMDALRRGDGAGEAAKMLEWLEEYAGRHFTFEEDCMHAASCPAAAENKRAHEEFMGHLKGLQKRFEVEGATQSFAVDLERRLAGWVVQHICGVDTELRKCAGAGLRPGQ